MEERKEEHKTETEHADSKMTAEKAEAQQTVRPRLPRSAETRFRHKGFIKETDNADYISYASPTTHDYVIFYKKKHHFETTAELDLAMLRACITQMKELGWEHRLNLD